MSHDEEKELLPIIRRHHEQYRVFVRHKPDLVSVGFRLPWWYGEVTIVVHYLTHLGILEALCERVRFARHRFGKYEVIDFFAVLVGSALRGERTLDWISWKQAALEMASEEVAPLR